MHIQVYDDFGYLYDLDKNEKFIDERLWIYSNTTNKHGLLPANITLRTSGLQKQARIVNNYQVIPYNLSRTGKSAEIVFPKIGKTILQQNLAEKTLIKLMKLPFQELTICLGIFCDIQLKEICSELLETYWNRDLIILPINELSYYNYDLNFYISDQVGQEGDAFFKIKTLKQYASKKVLIFTMESLKKWLESYFLNI